jgi:hypothetical protein
VPRGPPGAPKNVRVSYRAYHPMEVEVEWDPPDFTGGLNITNYKVSSLPPTESVESGGARGVVISGLNQATTYTFTVVAVNEAGTGPGASSPGLETTRPCEDLAQVTNGVRDDILFKTAQARSGGPPIACRETGDPRSPVATNLDFKGGWSYTNGYDGTELDCGSPLLPEELQTVMDQDRTWCPEHEKCDRKCGAPSPGTAQVECNFDTAVITWTCNWMPDGGVSQITRHAREPEGE